MSFDDIKESAAMAVATVRANKLRSALTILGVGIGVVTLTFMVSIIQGLNKAFAEQIESLGSNTIFVSKFDPSFGRPPNNEELHRKDITFEDAEAVRTEAADIIDSVAPIRRKIAAGLRYSDKETDTPILFGVTPEYEYTLSQYVERGRFVTEGDLRGRENVAILAQDVVRALFPNEDPLGKEIKIEGTPFRVVGVMETLGNFFGQSRDNSVFIPLPTFDKYWRYIEPPLVVFFIILRRQVAAGAKNNFGVSSQDSLLDFYNQLTGATWLVLTAISFVALMIGGIGVMNIMLVSVTERTKEIGVRKAVGATRANILWQFLIEAVVLTALGGLAGLIVGEVASLLTNRYSPLPAFVPLWAILVGIGISAAVGIVFGLWPAWKAARLDPIEALRYE